MSKTPYDVFFKTLSNPTRLEILHELIHKPKSIADLTGELEYDQTTLSHNMKRLLNCGFVTYVRKGKHKFFTINKHTILPLLKLIDDHTQKYCIHLLKKEDTHGK